MKEIPFEVEQELGVLKEDGAYSLRVCRVGWGGRPAKLDVRRWQTMPDGSMRPLRGLALDEDEALALRGILDGAVAGVKK